MTSRAPSPREVVEHVHRLTLNDDVTGQANLYAVNGVLEWPFAPRGVPRRVHGPRPSIQMFKIRDGEILLCRDYFARVETAGVSRPWSP
jgi:hypothetical protein